MGLIKTLRKLPSPVKDSIKERVYPSLLPEGETSPEWHLQSWDDSWHRHGRHWSVLFFYADGADEADAAELKDLQAHLAELTRLNVKVFAINPAESAVTTELAKDLGLAFPLLTDRGGPVSRMFGACLQLPLRPVYLSALYLINPDRKVRLSNRGRPSVEAVVRSVEALQRVTKGSM